MIVTRLSKSILLKSALWRLLDLCGLMMPLPLGYVILTYHRVVPTRRECDLEPALRVDAETFAAQMAAIREYATVIPLRDMVTRVADGKAPDRLYVAVTFDDGYADNFSTAYPILRAHEVPATFFISTGFLDDPGMVPWWDQIHALVRNAAQGTTLRWGDGPALQSMQIQDDRDRRRLYRLLTVRIKEHPAGITEPLGGLQLDWRSAGVNPLHRNEFMRWDDLQHLAEDDLVTVGAHTVTHPILSKCPDGGRREIESSKLRLELMLGKRIDVFAYPYGKFRHFSEPAVQEIRRLGFQAAVTNVPGVNMAGADLYRLRRVPIEGQETRRRFRTRLTVARIAGALP